MQKNVHENRNHGQSPVLKAALVGILIGLLLVPLGMVMALIHEREATRSAAEEEVSDKWGAQQTVGGPVLLVPYLTRALHANGKSQIVSAHATLLPRSLEIAGDLTPEIRYRGIFEVPLYTVQLRLSGTFAPEEISELSIPATEILWRDAVLSVGIPDPRGIRQTVTLRWDETELDFEPGSGAGSVFPSGIHSSSRSTAAGTSHSYRSDGTPGCGSRPRGLLRASPERFFPTDAPSLRMVSPPSGSCSIWDARTRNAGRRAKCRRESYKLPLPVSISFSPSTST
jgi:hypothetical protein